MARPELVHEATWKQRAIFDAEHGHFTLDASEDLGAVPVRLFLTPRLLTEAEPTLYRQIVNAARFPGVRLVALTPDVHYGYGVPVGCVILTSRDDEGAVAMGPVGFDIGCGMMSARSDVGAELASPDRKLAFHREVMKRVPMGVGGKTREIGRRELEQIVRGGAEELHVAVRRGDSAVAGRARARVERDRIPVDDSWSIPWGGAGAPERGLAQLGTLGGGNHFIELQRCEETGTLFVQVHTGSRGFGHGLATNYLAMAKDESGVGDIDLGYFTPRSPHFRDYLNAVAAGGNFAIANRLLIFHEIAAAFRKVFKADLELVYEISHNLVQAESHPVFGDVWVHRKGATRALPGGRPELAGTPWEKDGHPVLIPGSNRDHSFILRPLPGAERSGYSVNHGAGRRLSRGEASRVFDQQKVNEQYRRDHILVNLDGEVPLDESNGCYKSASEVVDAVVSAGLARVEHRLWPLGSLKGTDALSRAEGKKSRKESELRRDRDRDRARRDKRR
jgi:tRNA-splicing ligase RtcB